MHLFGGRGKQRERKAERGFKLKKKCKLEIGLSATTQLVCVVVWQIELFELNFNILHNELVVQAVQIVLALGGWRISERVVRRDQSVRVLFALAEDALVAFGAQNEFAVVFLDETW